VRDYEQKLRDYEQKMARSRERNARGAAKAKAAVSAAKAASAAESLQESNARDQRMKQRIKADSRNNTRGTGPLASNLVARLLLRINAELEKRDQQGRLGIKARLTAISKKSGIGLSRISILLQYESVVALEELDGLLLACDLSILDLLETDELASRHDMLGEIEPQPFKVVTPDPFEKE
jgi:hypothetical protein